ncbi:MAG: hypothetical protein C0399_02915 [Syntrophus sp. (in: bacteria)]|nr:hypothetical protein [Syntrophus sp. (in: bacteria)]
MKRTLVVKTLLLVTLLSLLLISFEAFAKGFKVEDGQMAYVTKIVTAENVKGVEVRLAILLRVDCNAHGLSLTSVRVSGGGDGWRDKYFFDSGGIIATQKLCPRDESVMETIYSNPVFIKSFTNKNVNNKVDVTIVIPAGYQLEVKEVK